MMTLCILSVKRLAYVAPMIPEPMIKTSHSVSIVSDFTKGNVSDVGLVERGDELTLLLNWDRGCVFLVHGRWLHILDYATIPTVSPAKRSHPDKIFGLYHGTW